MARDGVLPTSGQNLFDTPIFNAQVPKEGPKALPVTIPFAGANAPTTFNANLLLTQAQRFMSLVQAIFIDNSANSCPLKIISNVINQTVVFPPKSQGYIPLLVPQNGALAFSSEGGVDVPIILVNVPLPAMIWNVGTDGNNDSSQMVPASTTQVLGANGGAVGDYLDGLLIIPQSTSPGAVSITDGTGSPEEIFHGGTTTAVPFFVPIGSASKLGAWSVTTGANVVVRAVGVFT